MHERAHVPKYAYSYTPHGHTSCSTTVRNASLFRVITFRRRLRRHRRRRHRRLGCQTGYPVFSMGLCGWNERPKMATIGYVRVVFRALVYEQLICMYDISSLHACMHAKHAYMKRPEQRAYVKFYVFAHCVDKFSQKHRSFLRIVASCKRTQTMASATGLLRTLRYDP